MAKLVVICSCGQQSRVPYSALGRMGLCAGCGRTIRISKDNTRPEDAGPRVAPSSMGPGWWKRRAAPSPEAIERFGRGVDLYNQGRYGEALAVFDALAHDMPDTPEIEQARNHCMSALRRPRLPEAEPSSRSTGSHELTEREIQQVILEKMRTGETDADRIQLEAARLAAEVLGLIGKAAPTEGVPTGSSEHDGTQRSRPASGNGSARHPSESGEDAVATDMEPIDEPNTPPLSSP